MENNINLEELSKMEAMMAKVRETRGVLVAKKGVYAEQYKAEVAKLKSFGIEDPKQIPEKLKELNAQIEELTKKIKEENIPGFLEKYSKMSVDEVEDQRVMNQVDLTQDF